MPTTALVMAWMRRPDNPYFAKAMANRVWAHYFGRGAITLPPGAGHALYGLPTASTLACPSSARCLVVVMPSRLSVVVKVVRCAEGIRR